MYKNFNLLHRSQTIQGYKRDMSSEEYGKGIILINHL